MEAKNIEFWTGEEGRKYTGRNPQNPQEMDALYLKDYGVTRSEMNKRFLSSLPRDMKILEVGCNIGVQLWMLHDMGFKRLYGIDVQPIKESRPWYFQLAPAQKIPFKDNYFDLVFTSGLLIHIPPKELLTVMSEMYRVSRRYIFGFEYGSNGDTVPIEYQGETGLLWAADYRGIFRANFQLDVVDSYNYQLRRTEKFSTMYLLEKHA